MSHKKNKYEINDDVVGIIFPCYYYRLPKIVEKFLKKISITADYVFVITTYGSTSMTTLNYAEDMLNKRGITVDYTNKILMVDNYLPIFEINKELKKKSFDKINSDIMQIKDDIYNQKKSKIKFGADEKIISKFGTIMSHIILVPKHFYINDNCDHCHLCEQLCPVNNITITKLDVKINDNCEECFRCIHICPSNAIHIKHERSNIRFINPNVTIKELKNSNDNEFNI